MSRLATPLALAAAPALGGTAPALAQMVADVQFQRGNFGTMVNGAGRGDEYFDDRLGAKAGQKMFVELTVDDTNGNGSIYFNILPPGSDGNSTTVELPENGTYTNRAYLMGNDRDTGKTVGYRIDISIQ